MTWLITASVLAVIVAGPAPLFAQADLAADLAQLTALRSAMGSPETRVRVDATHRVWSMATASPHSEVRMQALALLEEPAGSASDPIRMPAVYPIAEIGAGSDETHVKIRALRALAEPLRASQVPIRDVAIDAINAITRSGRAPGLALAAVQALAEPVRSGNNGVRIPAINGVVRAVEGQRDDRACAAALGVLQAPLDSAAMIGGMEVRMMTIRAIERVGMEAAEVGTKAKAMGMLQAYAGSSGAEPEARRRAQEAAQTIERTLKR